MRLNEGARCESRRMRRAHALSRVELGFLRQIKCHKCYSNITYGTRITCPPAGLVEYIRSRSEVKLVFLDAGSVPWESSRKFVSCLKFTDESSIPEDEDSVLCLDLVGSSTLSNIDDCSYGIPLVSSHIVNSHSCSNSNPPQRFCWFVEMWFCF